MSYSVKIVKKPQLLIRIRGEVLGGQGKKLREVLSDVLENTTGSAVVDLSAVTFFDSSGLGIFLHAWKTWQAKKRSLIFLVPDGFARSMFEETNLIRQFTCISSLKEL
ncbi:MAG: STAS domain-containing protein [Chitinivibrionales bacterium]|nr:STAS domain-containing protein [Chitinivibrionales bacterium]